MFLIPGRITSEAFRYRAFLCWEVFNYWVNLITSHRPRSSHTFTSSWFTLGGLYVSRKLSTSPRVYNWSYFSFNLYFYKISSNVVYHFQILIIWVLFFVVSVAKSCLYYRSLERTNIWLHWFSLFLFSILVFIISFLLLALDLVCTSYAWGSVLWRNLPF